MKRHGPPIHLISLGAGVQSSAMALMASCGEITPMPMAAIFADTQGEPESVYEWLNWLASHLAFPVHRVTKGSLARESARVRISKAGNAYTNSSVPAFIAGNSGQGILMRQCTRDFKVNVLVREARHLAGSSPVVQWIGISRDEAHRMKDSRTSWITNRWPLIEQNMTRRDCLTWLAAHGYPEPPRSACVFCPYHSDAEWARLKRDAPRDFARAVSYEQAFQVAAALTRFKGVPYLHRSLVPLDQVRFEPDSSQGEMFGAECEGLCGV